MTASNALALDETLLSETSCSYRALGVELGPSDVVKNTHGLAVARLRALPVRRGKYWYYPRYDGGRTLYCRSVASDNDIRKYMHGDFQDWVDEVVHPDLVNSVKLGVNRRTGRLFSIEHIGRGRMRMLVMDGAPGRSPAVVCSIDNVGSTAAWADDSNWIFYTKLDDALRPAELWARNVDDPGSEIMLHSEDDKRCGIVVYANGGHVFSLSSTPEVSESAEYRIGADGAWIRNVLINRSCGLLHRVFAVDERDGTRRYLVRHLDSAGVQILSWANERDLDASVCIAKWSRVFGGTPGTALTDVYVVSNHIVVGMRADALPKVGVIDMSSAGDIFIVGPDGDADDLVGVRVVDADEDGSALRVALEYYTRQIRVIDYRYVDGKSVEIPFDMEEPDISTRFIATREYVRSGGVDIPMTFVHSEEVRPDGRAPGVLVAYGCYQSCLDPAFTNNWLELLQRGVVIVYAHVRGGGEMGSWWHEQGRGINKVNSLMDFDVCARYAIESGWVAEGRLGAVTASAGAILVASSINRNPGLFRACLLRQPFVDPHNVLRDPGLPLVATDWSEFGNPLEDQRAAEMIRSYSPLQNVRAQDYPAIGVVLGELDSRISNSDVVEWVERIRSASTSSLPIYIDAMMGVGHGCGDARFELAFWERELLNA